MCLNMSLYGLKQVSRQWNKTLTTRLREMKFEQCPVDPCLMRLIIDGEIVALVVMYYVDDIMSVSYTHLTLPTIA